MDLGAKPAQAAQIWSAMAPAQGAPWRAWAAALYAAARSGDSLVAEHAACAVMAAFPKASRTHIFAAETAMRRQDWAVAELRWRAALAIKPSSRVSRHGLAETLISLDRLDEADAVLQGGARQADGPAGQMLKNLALRVRLAAAAGEFTKACAALEALKAASPPPHLALTQQRLIKQAAAARLGRGGTPLRALLADPDAASGDVPDLVARFESLGQNCEFGFLQRACGAEPLSLLRWAGISPQACLSGLQTEFAGIGDPAFTEVRPRQPGDWELRVYDTRYGLAMHTHVKDAPGAAEQTLPRICKQLRFLRAKLLEDLAEGEKIFIRRTHVTGPVGQAALVQAVRRYNPRNVVLFVISKPPGAPRPPVSLAGPGLLLGAASGGKSGGLGDPWDPHCADWLATLREAIDLRDAARNA